MGEIINIEERIKRSLDNLIISTPWEFRKSDWGSLYFVQMTRANSDRLEHARLGRDTSSPPLHLPVNFTLKGSLGYSIRAMYAYRGSRDKMKEIYYLIGLMDCMINQVNPILRTDLLRDMYKRVLAVKREFNVTWLGHLDHVLLPVDSIFYSESAYRASLNNAGTMKELYHVIKKGTDEMFDVISKEYVFYCPDSGV